MVVGVASTRLACSFQTTLFQVYTQGLEVQVREYAQHQPVLEDAVACWESEEEAAETAETQS